MGRSDDVAGSAHFFDQPDTGASDPAAGALLTLEQWADSITAVLDDLGSSEAVLLAVGIGFAPAALFAATHPSRTTALVVLGGYADAGGTLMVQDEPQAAMVRLWGSGEIQRLMNPDMPWNEEIRATWARMERLAASPAPPQNTRKGDFVAPRISQAVRCTLLLPIHDHRPQRGARQRI